MAAVEDHEDVGFAGRHLGDELRQLLVRQIPAVVVAAVVADQRLVEAVGLQVPEFGRRRRLGTVSTVVKQRHIAGLRLPQMAAEGFDDACARGLGVGKHQRLEHAVVVDAVLEQCLDALNVIDAAVQRTHRRRVGVDADEESVDGAGHGWVSFR